MKLEKAPLTLKEVTSFNIAAVGVTELNWCDYCAEVEIRRTEGEGEMTAFLYPAPELSGSRQGFSAPPARNTGAESEGEIERDLSRYQRTKSAAFLFRRIGGQS